MVGACKLVKEMRNVVNYAYASGVTAWTPIHVALMGVLVPMVTGVANAMVAYYNGGVFSFCVTSSVAVTIGSKVYYDSTTNKITLIPNANTFPLGTALTAGTGTSTGTVFVDVDVNVFGVSDGVLEKIVTLTNAQVKTLNATPVEVIAAPGTGKVTLIESVMGKLNYATAGFDSVGTGDDFVLKYTNASGGTAAQLETTGWLDQTADTYQYGTAQSTVKPVANAALVAHILAGEIYGSAGGGSVTLQIRYRVQNII